jgi:hypothetical protein
MRARVLENDSLERDLTTGAIINADASAYTNALQRRHQQKMLDAERKSVQTELTALRQTCEFLQTQINELKKSI